MKRRLALLSACLPILLAGAYSPGGDPMGRLVVSADAAGAWTVGGFEVTLDDQQLAIRQGGRERFATPPGEGFVAGAVDATSFHESRGMITIDEQLEGRCRDQAVDAAALDGGVLTLVGTLDCEQGPVPWSLKAAAERGTLVFTLTSEAPINRLYLAMTSTPDEAFLGFGEQYSVLNMKGRRLPIVVSEQGLGRGAQPITLGANLAAGAGGDWWTSYAGVPHFLTSRMRSMALENTEPAVFDLRDRRRAIVEVYSSEMRGRVYAGDDPAALIGAHTAWAGRQRPLPEWITSGAVIGMQGGTERVREALATLEGAGTPLAGFWLQDWVGQRVTSFGKQLWWSWTLDTNRYPGWDALVSSLNERGLEVMVYINPFLVDVSVREDGEYRNLYAEALAAGLFVEKDGEAYPLTNTDFDAGLLDLTDPAVRAWTVDLIRAELAGVGAKGWMADFGEALPFDAELSEGQGLAAHNRYPELWAEVNREAVEGLAASEDYVFFMRSAFTRSPSSASLFWLGDQMVSWDRHDGIKTAVAGLLSSGLSGFAFNHSDIGGYTTITSPIGNYHRSQELYWRWTELAAFNVVFRTHEGNQPENNHQFDSDAQTLNHFTRMATVYTCWEDYRRALVEEASETGLPVVRHPWLHYPGEAAYRDLIWEQFMVGSELMVAPVVDRGADAVRVRFPEGGGDWVHLLTGESYGPGRHRVDAPVGQPAAFHRAGSVRGEAIAGCLQSAGLAR